MPSPTPIRVAINGFGRIGRQSFKVAYDKPHIEVVAINDLTDPKVAAHLLKYDSVYGTYNHDVVVEESGEAVSHEGEETQKEHFAGSHGDPSFLLVDGHKSAWVSIKDPANLPWGDLNIDVVLECTGRFTRDGAARAHIDAGAKRVIVSAPAKGSGDVATFLKGVNHESYTQGDSVISNASCTTNCVSPVVSLMNQTFGVEKAGLTTIHAVTAEQNLVDAGPPGLHEDLRRGRSALVNIVPTTTGAAIATTKVIPDLEGSFDGIAVRVPVVVGSLSDFTFLVSRDVSVEEVNEAFINAADNPLYHGVLDVAHEPLVSSDIIKNPHSAIVDLTMTKVIAGNLVKVVAWYDNEWGYSNRLVEMIDIVAPR